MKGSNSVMTLLRNILIFCTVALLGLGVLMVYSAHAAAELAADDWDYLLAHLSWLAAGSIAAGVLARLPARLIRRLALPLSTVTVLLLLWSLPAGRRAGLFDVGPIQFRLAELAKLSVVLLVAWCGSGTASQLGRSWRGWPGPLGFVLLVSLLLVLAGEVGSAGFVLALGLLMLFVAGVPLRLFALLLAAGAPLLVAVMVAPRSVLVRPWAWLGPNEAVVSHYHVRQSESALRSGGLWGAGLGRGWQKIGFAPQANTDFVFAVIGEELGLAGTLTVIALFGLLLLSTIGLASGLGADAFAQIAVAGLGVELVMQAIVNISVVTVGLPPHNVPLPLVSYGGSQLFCSLAAVGAIVGLTTSGGEAREQQFEEAHECLPPVDETKLWARGG